MEQTPMAKFDFLLGDWELEYRIPKSSFSEAGTYKGVGTFQKILNDRYVQFDYGTKSKEEAKGIFAWDEKVKIYRYWWFENSGSYQEASCNFINENTLAMNWHDTLLVQTFTKVTAQKVLLEMSHPAGEGEYERILEVIMTRSRDIP